MIATTLSPRASSLADYIRILADRMGMKDWQFEVRENATDIEPYASRSPWVTVRSRATTTGPWVEVMPACGYPGQSPEDHRLEIVRLLVRTRYDGRYPREECHALAAILAPSLPLPEADES